MTYKNPTVGIIVIVNDKVKIEKGSSLSFLVDEKKKE